MSNNLPATELDRIADVISRGPYDGYPAHEDRLFIGAAGLRISPTELFVPDGPWHVEGHDNRAGKDLVILDLEVPTEIPNTPHVLQWSWRESGLVLDQYGRPTHPDAQQLLTDERIGLPTGLGFFYRYGPNATVDPAVYRQRGDNSTELLMIKRQNGGLWALPGGFLDREDLSAEAAARREAGEETGLTDIGGTDEVILHKRPVGLRDTLHAWTENTVVLIHGDQDYLSDTEPQPGDDAVDVGWFTEDQIAGLDTFDAHQVYIGFAFKRIRDGYE